jgi:hypothetical protein
MRTTNEPHLRGLHEVAEEIGVSHMTVLRHPRDFFPTVLLGGRRYVTSRSYAAWLKRTYAASGVEPDGREPARAY